MMAVVQPRRALATTTTSLLSLALIAGALLAGRACCTVIVGDSFVTGNPFVYTLDTTSNPPALTNLYTTGNDYVSGCVDSADGVVHVVNRANTAAGGAPLYRIDTLSISTGDIVTGTTFEMTTQIDGEDVKCDEVWHTVLLLTFSNDSMTVTVHSVVPATGVVTTTASFASAKYPIGLISGGQTYCSETHTYFMTNFEHQRPAKHEFWFATIAINMASNEAACYPYEQDGFNLEDNTAFSQTPEGTMLGLLVNITGSDFLPLQLQRQRAGLQRGSATSVTLTTTLCYFAYEKGVFTLVGDATAQEMLMWAVGAVVDEGAGLLFDFERPGVLRSWDLTTGAHTAFKPVVELQPYTFAGFYHS
eukprot:TRINITY_DN17135_c0_g1_i1.p1 TRINITY_DN17135_c0_g1~~TRINITY_DN17135_c0_g1_i1.p1  ORF type:complete len:361 (-),score=89.48 TRINITY_DN17135_c0_g1_i1:95-1177(-)